MNPKIQVRKTDKIWKFVKILNYVKFLCIIFCAKMLGYSHFISIFISIYMYIYLSIYLSIKIICIYIYYIFIYMYIYIWYFCNWSFWKTLWRRLSLFMLFFYCFISINTLRVFCVETTWRLRENVLFALFQCRIHVECL